MTKSNRLQNKRWKNKDWRTNEKENQKYELLTASSMGEDFNKLKMVAKIIKTFIHLKGKTLSKPDITENLVKLEMDARNEELNHIIIYYI